MAARRPLDGSRGRLGNHPCKGELNDDCKRIPLDVNAGDRILFGTYAGREIRLDGEEYVIIMKEDGHADRHTPLAERRRARRNHG
ncbi:MAG: hypothetical protein DMF89_03455 [Acidobacteria bacterium]|nr:MAG: hypothetical protein DMF89_03455 [Acidobacteriota bacterium]